MTKVKKRIDRWSLLDYDVLKGTGYLTGNIIGFILYKQSFDKQTGAKKEEM